MAGLKTQPSLFPTISNRGKQTESVAEPPEGARPVATRTIVPFGVNDAAERRVALVIGNGRYPDSTLKNPPNDAHAMATKLRSLNFYVQEHIDLWHRSMLRVITDFANTLRRNDVALFFYAGHGMQVKGKNFLIPVDAVIASENSVHSDAVDLDAVLSQLPSDSESLNIIILDACRNNPFTSRFRGTSGGLAKIDAPYGTLIAYSTQPGGLASDGDFDNGLYTRELLRAIDQLGIPVEAVFKQVRNRVAAASNEEQVPWESNALRGEFFFAGKHYPSAAIEVPQGPSGTSSNFPALGVSHPISPIRESPDSRVWMAVKESTYVDELKLFISHFPDSPFAQDAQKRLHILDSTRQLPRPAAVGPMPFPL